jgi:hypothetical protein
MEAAGVFWWICSWGLGFSSDSLYVFVFGLCLYLSETKKMAKKKKLLPRLSVFSFHLCSCLVPGRPFRYISQKAHGIDSESDPYRFVDPDEWFSKISNVHYQKPTKWNLGFFQNSLWKTSEVKFGDFFFQNSLSKAEKVKFG